MEAESWVAIIAAVASAIVAIISAWRGEQTKKELVATKHELAEAKADGVQAAAALERQIEVTSDRADRAFAMAAAPPLPAALPPSIPEDLPDPGVSFGDMLKYVALGQQVASILEGLSVIEPGEEIDSPTIKSKWRGKRFELPTGPLRRMS